MLALYFSQETSLSIEEDNHDSAERNGTLFDKRGKFQRSHSINIDKQNLTPFTDSLIHMVCSLKLYVSGTRTVRGLEALCHSAHTRPVDRKEDQIMAHLQHGQCYEVEGVMPALHLRRQQLFDNMGYFFGHNGYRVIDRRIFPKKDHQETVAWVLLMRFHLI